jgi:hypothetical protein
MVLYTPKHVVTCYHTTNNMYIVISILYIIVWKLRCVGFLASIGRMAVNNSLEWVWDGVVIVLSYKVVIRLEWRRVTEKKHENFGA